MKAKSTSHSTAKVHRIVKFVREERVVRGLTQKELGGIAGMSQSSVGRFESGDNTIVPLYTIEKMLAALGYELRIVVRKR